MFDSSFLPKYISYSWQPILQFVSITLHKIAGFNVYSWHNISSNCHLFSFLLSFNSTVGTLFFTERSIQSHPSTWSTPVHIFGRNSSFLGSCMSELLCNTQMCQIKLETKAQTNKHNHTNKQTQSRPHIYHEQSSRQAWRRSQFSWVCLEASITD